MSALEKIRASPIFPPATYWVSSDATSADSVALKSAFINSVISPKFCIHYINKCWGKQTYETLNTFSPYSVRNPMYCNV